MVTFPQDLSLQDLRAIIHGLKMAGFTSLDEGAVDHVKFRINSLPSAEALSQIAQNPKVFRDLIVEVGEIMSVIEKYSKQGAEYSARFKSKKKLPPRYKVLEWRSDMKNIKEKTDVDVKAAVVAFVKMSSDMDNIGHGVISGKLLKCATNIQSETYNQQEVDEIVTMLKSAGLEDEAIRVAGLGGFLGGIGKAVAAPFRDIWQKGRAGGLDADFTNVARQIERVYVKMQKLTADSKKAGNTQIAQQMEHLMQAIQAAAQGWNKVLNEANSDAGAGGQTQQPQGAQGAQGAQGKQQAPQGSAEAPAEANLQNQIADADIEEALKLAKGEKTFNRTAALDEKTKNWILELKRNSPEQYQSLMSSLQKRKEAMPKPQTTATNPATPAASAPSTTPTVTPQQKPPVGTNAKLVPRQQKPQTNTGDPKADEFVNKLKKVPGDDISLYEVDGKRYKIVEASKQKWIQIV